MIIKFTLSLLFVSACFQAYFWSQGCPPRKVELFRRKAKPVEDKEPVTRIVFENEQPDFEANDNKPFITHLIEVNNDMDFTEWEVEMNQ